ncbi:MAG: DNA repair exonuclease [Dictyoglomaceae bacterium]
MLKILITADSHLGRYYRKMLPERLQERRRRLRNSLQEVIDYAIEEKVDIFIQAGDLFDLSNPRNQDLTFIAREFAKLKRNNIETYAIGGNHDAPNMVDNDSFPIKIFEEAGLIKVFPSQSTVKYKIYKNSSSERVLIGGLSHDPRKKGRMDPLEKIIVPPDIPSDEDLFKILILHYSFEKFAHPKAQEPQVTLASLSTLPFNLYILGHLHKKNEYRFEDKLLLIPGSTERFEFGEENITPGFYLLRIQSKKVSFEHHKVNVQPMRNIAIKLTEVSEEDPTGSIIERIVNVSQKDQLLKCNLIGAIPLSIYQRINFSKLLEEGTSLNFLFDLDTQNLKILGKEINTLPVADLSLDKVINDVTEKYIEDNINDRETIIEAMNWIRETLKEEKIL